MASLPVLFDTASSSSGGAGVVVFYVIALAIAVLLVASVWRIFSKAGKPGWAAIIPIYNTLVELQIVGRPWWWLLLIAFVPVASTVCAIILVNDLSKSFGKGIGFTLGLIIFPYIFYPILGFGDARYVGPVAAPVAAQVGGYANVPNMPR